MSTANSRRQIINVTAEMACDFYLRTLAILLKECVRAVGYCTRVW